jgi:nucleoside-diphosphate-sugar epimerase
MKARLQPFGQPPGRGLLFCGELVPGKDTLPVPGRCGIPFSNGIRHHFDTDLHLIITGRFARHNPNGAFRRMATAKLIIGCGYLGRRVARRWIADGDTVYALTRSPDNARQFESLGIHPIPGDVLNRASLHALPPAESVLYAVGFDRRAGQSRREVYVDGLENVLSVATGGRPSKFIYVSSTSVYGQNTGEWVDENSECRPESPNGQVCLEAEQRLHRQFPPAMIVRLAGLYGPERLVARIDQLRAGAPLAGNPDAWLNVIHVEDAAAAIIACERLGRAGSIYLGCDDRPIPRREYYARLAALVGAPPPGFDGGPLSADERPQNNKRCCNRRIRDELRMELRFPTIVEGLPAAL